VPSQRDVARRLQSIRAGARDGRALGVSLKVALIARPYDLGTAYSLMGKPQLYARFLGQEIVFYLPVA
jgi:hypothetical protein